MIYRTEEYKGYTISFRQANEATSKRQSRVSFKINKDGFYGAPCGCYWCKGYWWMNEDYARLAAHTIIDEEKFNEYAGMISGFKIRGKINQFVTKSNKSYIRVWQNS